MSTRKQTTQVYTTADFLQQADSSNVTFKLQMVLFGRLIQSGNPAAAQYLDKWERYCMSQAGMREIGRAGGREPEMVMLIQQQDDTEAQDQGNQVVETFRQCSPREKFLIRAFNEVCASMNERGSDEPLQNAIALDAEEVPADMAVLSAAMDALSLC